MNTPVFLVCHRGALGDFLLTLPVIYQLKQHYQSHRFIGLGKPEYMKLAFKAGLFDEIYNCESAAYLPFFEGRVVPSEFQTLSYLLAWFQPLDEMQHYLERQKVKAVFYPPFPDGETKHMLTYNAGVLPLFALDTPLKADLSSLCPSVKQESVLIHPGSGSTTKNYAPEFYLFIANELQTMGYKQIQFLLGPCELALEPLFKEHFPVIKPGNPYELAQALSSAKLYIGNDSGVSHLAGFLGRPSVAFYKATNPAVWGIAGRQVYHVEATLESIAMAKLQKVLKQLKGANIS
ncbi:MAG: glycosyltransferase family 9 protein [Fibrobacteria bacterium]|nr:glycosyltransferase family 9 protein [Fibrobacteria bacterium]